MIEHRGRRGVAQAEAVDRLQRHAAVRGGAAHVHTELLACAFFERPPAGSLTGLGEAKLQGSAAARLALEVMIKGHAAMHLGARDIERIGDHRLGVERYAAEGVLQGVQNWERGALLILMLRDDFARALRRPWFMSWHCPAALLTLLRRFGAFIKMGKNACGINKAAP
jgi:hypothetical protein